MSKKVYGWGSDNVFNFYDLVPDDYQLQANQTFDSPLVVKDGVATLNQPVKRVAGGWQQPTDEEHKAWVEANQKLFPQPEQSSGPTAQDKLNATTSLQLAQLLADRKKQDQLNAQLTIDLANLKKQLQSKTAQATA